MGDERAPSLPFKQPLYLFSLPKEIVESLETVEPIAQTNSGLLNTFEEPENAFQTDASARGTACTACNQKFESVGEQRAHAKSDFHAYNIKQKSYGLPTVSEEDFEQSIHGRDLDESISGSEASSTDSDSSLRVKRRPRAVAQDAVSVELSETTKDGKHDPMVMNNTAMVWLTSRATPPNIRIGIYKVWFSSEVLEDLSRIPQAVREKQHPRRDPTQMVRSNQVPHIFLCMIGGGHFAAMVVELALNDTEQLHEDRKVGVLAHKTFHRYTTRRKQGGAQTLNDSAKGTAHSAGSSLRRYNEVALTSEIRNLLSQWRSMIDSSELLFVRATGSTNRKTLFGAYEGQVLHQSDRRIRSFPFTTRRATQSELMRSFVDLSRIKVKEHIPATIIEDTPNFVKQDLRETKSIHTTEATSSQQDSNVDMAVLHTSQLESLIRRSKAPALISYMSNHSLNADFEFVSNASEAQHHAPTALHYAASVNSAPVVYSLLVKAGANPSLQNGEGKYAFQLAGERSTRDAFRQARSELGEDVWPWDIAKVPHALTKAEILERSRQDRLEEERTSILVKEKALTGLPTKNENVDSAQLSGDINRKGLMTIDRESQTLQEIKDRESRGMSQEMQRQLERERRARAAEERIRQMSINK